MVRYWDETSTAAVLEFEVEEPVQPAAPVKEKKEKKKVKGTDISIHLHYAADVMVR